MLQSTENNVAFITGVTGQDGYYLSRLLLKKGYTVHGLIRPSSRSSHLECSTLDPRIIQHTGDMLDMCSLRTILFGVMPDEIYHLAAQSHVPASFDLPYYTVDVIIKGTQHLVEIAANINSVKKVKLLNACSSEVFGRVAENPQKETTPFNPLSPYAIGKAATFWITSNARNIHKMFAVNAISFNHESPRRRANFVTRKITLGVARISNGLGDTIELGNLNACRDWSHSRDIVRGMHMMLQHTEPIDFVLASGETHSVRRFVELAFGAVGIPIEWRGSGLDEVGVDASLGKVLIRVNAKFYRPLEVVHLHGCPEKARDLLLWQAEISLKTLVDEMIEADLTNLENILCTRSML